MDFDDEEIKLIQDAVAHRFCFLETGQCHLSYEDMKRMGEQEWKKHGCRMPSREQLAAADEYRKLWQRLLNRRS